LERHALLSALEPRILNPMNSNIAHSPRPDRRARVIALHCSGADASQWRHLAAALGSDYELLAPGHFGSEGAAPWTGEHAFTLADEAASTLAVIDQCQQKFHLVGHSYGGGVALNAAVTRPDKIASMVLYEPSAFHLLRQMGSTGVSALAEITQVAQRTSHGVLTGDYRGAVAGFVDYWNGAGTWDVMRPALQSGLIRWCPKAPLDFRALMEEATPPDAYRSLAFPVLVLQGEHAPTPTHIISRYLADLLPNCRLIVVGGAGHMGPLTHAPEVSSLIVRHLVECQPPVASAAPERGAADLYAHCAPL
jgi:pimeloyl-ACP methyl ester carboxylesterase